jgi:hypothetical protein
MFAPPYMGENDLFECFYFISTAAVRGNSFFFLKQKREGSRAPFRSTYSTRVSETSRGSHRR